MSYTIQAETKWPVSQAAKTSPSHGEDGGSIPPRVTKKETSELVRVSSFLLFDIEGESNGSVVNDCRWQSDADSRLLCNLAPRSHETDSPTGHKKHLG